MIAADKIAPHDVYKPIGKNPVTEQVDPNTTVAGKERIER